MNEIEITAELKKELSELLDNSKIKTPEKARAVAGRLLRRGIQPTWRLIREILGTGSATTLQKVVNEYWNELGSYLDKLEKRPDLPEKLVVEFNNVWDSALQLAEKQIKTDLDKEFTKVKEIEDEINKKNKVLSEELKEQTELKIASDAQLEQLKIEFEAQLIALEQREKSQQILEATLERNKKEFADSLNAQQQTNVEKYTQLQQTYHVLEQSLEQAKQLLSTNKLQQELAEKQSQEIIAELKQAKQAELDRQAKQYDSMLEHYSREIGQLKTKLEATEKQQRENNKKLQAQHEGNLVTVTELQSNVAMLTQNNKQLEKKNTDKSSQIEDQRLELQQLHKDFAKLEARFEVLNTKK
jgi:DNA repair exonuclease SbcCD ATPase subunit